MNWTLEIAMPTISETWMLVMVVMLHLIGLASAAAARIHAANASGIRHNFFYCTLLGVGLYAMLAFMASSGLWLPSSATFSLMVLGATFDTSGRLTTRTFTQF